MRTRLWVAPLLFLLLLLGCSKSTGTRLPVHPVKGAVFVDGKPAAGAVIVLHPRTPPHPAGTPLPRAQVGSDGSFVLTTYRTGDGAPAGEYAVAITWKERTEYAEQEGPDLLPPALGDPKLSGLQAVVLSQQQSTELPPFRLSRNKP